MVVDTYENELKRIDDGPSPNDVPGGVGTVRFIVSCGDDAEIVLSRAKEVLSSLLRQISIEWRPFDELSLPNWFVEQCELERVDLSTLTEQERNRVEALDPWSLEGWVGWFNPNDPDAREWRWWDAAVLDKNYLVVAVEVDNWPFAYGALSWLFRASGATDVSPQVDET